MIIPAGLLIVSGLATFLSSHPMISLLPFLFGAISTVGYYFKRSFIFDFSLMLSVLSYLAGNVFLVFHVINLIVVIAVIFSYFTLWFLGRNGLVLRNIYSSSDEGILSDEWNEFIRISSKEIVNEVFLASVLTIFGSFLAVNSFVDIGGIAERDFVFVMVFAFTAFLIIYIMMNFLSMED